MREKIGVVSALIKYQMDTRGELLKEQIAVPVNDQKAVERLAACFPALGTKRETGVAGGWFPGALVLFVLTDGTNLQVRIDPSWRFWTEGHGDWGIEQGTRDIIEGLVRGNDVRGR